MLELEVACKKLTALYNVKLIIIFIFILFFNILYFYLMFFFFNFYYISVYKLIFVLTANFLKNYEENNKAIDLSYHK